MSEEYREGEFDISQLKKSLKAVGYLYPVLKSRNGKTLDGLHRKQIDPSWPEKIIDVETPYQEALIRLWANYRRKVSSEEVRQLIVQMAEELRKQGYKPGQIVKKLAEETPYSEQHIRKMLPKEFKRDYERLEEKIENIISSNANRSRERFTSTDLSVSGKGAEFADEEDEVERVRREVREFLETPEQQEMIRKDAEFMAKHAKEFLMKPPKSFKRKHALGAVEDLLDADLITPKDLIRIAVKRGFKAKDIARYLIRKGHLRLRCPRCGHPIEEVRE